MESDAHRYCVDAAFGEVYPLAVTRRLLKEWQQDKCRANIWFYSISFSIFHISIINDLNQSSLDLFSVDCTHICGPLGWDNANLTVQVEECVIKGRQWNTYFIIDETAGFRLECAKVVLKEASVQDST